jgi:hypothetical protein
MPHPAGGELHFLREALENGFQKEQAKLNSSLLAGATRIRFTPLEIIPCCSALYTMRCRALQARYSGITSQIIPTGFNAPLEFLTGFTPGDFYVMETQTELRHG